MALTTIKDDALPSIPRTKLAADAIDGTKLADDAIANEHIADDAVGSSQIADDAITSALIADDAVDQARIADEAVDEARLQVSNAGSNGQFLSKQSGNTGGLTWADSASEGSEVKSTTNGNESTTKFLSADGDGTSSWQEVGATSLTSTLDLSSHTVTLPAAAVTAHVTQYNDDIVQNNIAMLGFKVAAANDLTKFNLVDQVIDEFEDASGIDAGASTNELVSAGAVTGAGTQSVTPTCTGGSVATDGDYKVHTITSDTNYVTDTTQEIDIMLIAGGGSGGNHGGGGGGAGGVIYATTWELAAGTHAVVIGSGGQTNGAGEDSTFGTGPLLTSIGGGQGSHNCNEGSANAPYGGGSGGGSVRSNVQFSGLQPSQPGVSGSSGFGNPGGYGNRTSWGGPYTCGGGGGSGSAGGNSGTSSPYVPGDAGNGKSISITGSAVTYAGGGGSANHVNHTNGHATSGGSGGGGNGSTGNPAPNGADATGYGSGGGGSGINSNGGGTGSDGICVVRRKTTFNQNVYNDLTLQSTDTTAEAVPTKADFVILMENVAGTATVNTDIKGYISRDSGANFTQGTFVDEGSWGTNKKVLAFHDLSITGQPSGSAMCYKITTHNQAVGKQTKIHATSMGWR